MASVIKPCGRAVQAYGYIAATKVRYENAMQLGRSILITGALMEQLRLKTPITIQAIRAMANSLLPVIDSHVR